jgi:phosphatidylserine/phosphatidylglycerophosphate/cardiolipin synthase-like enzyme
MSADLGSLKLYVGPTQLGAPDNLAAVIIDFIDRAREQLFIAVQELESRPIAEAILRAKRRGVRVRLILEGKYLTVDTPPDDPWAPGGDNEHNREIHAALLRAKVGVITDLNPATYHQKFIVRDPDDSRAAVLTGSTNFTPTGVEKNLNHIVVVEGKRVSSLYLDEFIEAWTGTFGQVNERHDAAPKCYHVSKVPVKVLFAPDHAPEMEIMKQMLKARERVDFAMFTFAQSSGIDDTMIFLSKAGIPVRGVLDRMQANQVWAATRPVIDAGGDLWWPRPDSGVRKVHHKLMVIDKKVVIAGSFNYTGPANALNDENIIVIGDTLEPDPEAQENQQQFAAYAFQEIERIIQDLSEYIPFPTL